jgi:LacI family transcriptional regulator
MGVSMSKPRRIAVVINLNWTMKHHHEVFGGIQEFARERGWESELCPFAPELIDAKKRRKYDGVIGRVTPQMEADAKKAKISLVNVWMSSPATGVPSVGPDDVVAGRMAAEHLLSRGFRKFGYVGFRRTSVSRTLDRAFRDVLRGAGSNSYSRILNSTSFCDSPRAWDTFQREIRAWTAGLEAPIGVLAATDKLARYVIDAARDRGLEVPKDMAVVGIGNEEVVCMNPEPSITSIELGFHKVGERAAELLGDLMARTSIAEKHIALPPVSLIPRRSTDAYDVADGDVAQALRFMADNCHRPIKVRDVIAQASLSWRSMERRFNEVRGGTIAGEIRRLRIERAKRLLSETEMLVKQVAEACGFADTRRLCEVFAKDVEESPEQYRLKRRSGA